MRNGGTLFSPSDDAMNVSSDRPSLFTYVPTWTFRRPHRTLIIQRVKA